MWLPRQCHLLIIATALTSAHARAQEPAVDFNRDVRPILSGRCFKCHGFDAAQREAGLRLDTLAGATANLESGRRAIEPGKPDASELLRRVSSPDTDLRMPPDDQGKPLADAQVEVLRRWIAQGASYRKHWAFVPPERAALPAAGNPIDYFILRKLETHSIAPSPQAAAQTLNRRLHLDLLGLPPSASNAAPDIRDGYEALVDHLLASPAYGERMAQYWLDLARHADTSGFAADRTRQMWPFRDWVVRAFNSNMPFDQFTIEQLAGDLLPDATIMQRIATGFHRNAMQAKGNNPRKEEFRVRGVVDRVNTTGRTWLGLTLECAECHAHKFDPITQREYYQLFAIFNNTPHLGKGYDVHGPMLAYHEPSSADPTVMQPVQANVMEELPEPRETFVHIRGNFENRGGRVHPGLPAALPAPVLADGEKIDRLALARWLTRLDHPLTARVYVNRLWERFFGTGLVKTSADFGFQGEFPSHPELLDWLAVEFVESGWDVKHLVKLIVTSATYRQSSTIRAELAKRDPDNRLVSRASRFRLPAEQIRDSALAAGGLLDRRVGGKPVFPPQPDGYYEERGQTLPGNSNFKWVESKGSDRHRRTLYTYWKRMALHPSLAAFDAPPRQVCTVKRSITNTPQQALVGLNDPMFVEAARGLAQFILTEVPDGPTDRRIELAFARCLSRAPDPEEIAAFAAFVGRQRERFAPDTDDADLAAWTTAASALMNTDEFFTRE